MTVGRCVRCGRDVPDNAHYCPGCGFDLHDARPHTATGLLHPSQLLRGRYQIEHRLAQGGQSAVYLAYDLYDGGSPRAVKEMSEANLGPVEREKAINDFFREAEMLRTLDHPALAKVYDVFIEGQKHFLVMEYVRGHNLEDELIDVGRPLEWDRVTEWGIALCDVLAYLHGNLPPIIYRDLKPANVMLTLDGSLKLIDFGIARWLHPARPHDTSQLGTDGYAPLEQYTARSEPRSDVYALGASLYHLLTGRVPEGAPLRVAGQQLTPVRAINPAVPEELERVIHTALALHVRDRYQSAQEMRAALLAFLQPQRPDARVSGPLSPTATPSSPPSFTPRTPTPAPARINMGSRGAANGTGARRNNTSGPLPRLRIWPLRLDAGFLEVNDTAVLRLEVSNQGGGELEGITETNHHSLRVDPGVVTADTAELLVFIDTAGLRDGPYTCHLAVRTNGGDQIIPVRFIVRPPLSTTGSIPRIPAV
jgi:serine/threonine protein kinase